MRAPNPVVNTGHPTYRYKSQNIWGEVKMAIRKLTFVCSDIEIKNIYQHSREDVADYMDNANLHCFQAIINFYDVSDLSAKLGEILNEHNLPKELKRHVHVWDIEGRKLLLKRHFNLFNT